MQTSPLYFGKTGDSDVSENLEEPGPIHDTYEYVSWTSTIPSERWYGRRETFHQNDDIARGAVFVATKLIPEYTNAFLSVSVDRARSPRFLAKLQELTHTHFTPYARGNPLHRHREIFLMALFQTCAYLVQKAHVGGGEMGYSEKEFVIRELFYQLLKHEGLSRSDYFNIVLMESELKTAIFASPRVGSTGSPAPRDTVLRSRFSQLADNLREALNQHTTSVRPEPIVSSAAFADSTRNVLLDALEQSERRLHGFVRALDGWLRAKATESTVLFARTGNRSNEAFAQLGYDIVAFYTKLRSWFFERQQRLPFFRSHLAVKLFLLVLGIGVLHLCMHAFPELRTVVQGLTKLLNDWFFTGTVWSTPGAPGTWDAIYEAMEKVLAPGREALTLVYTAGEVIFTLVVDPLERCVVRHSLHFFLEDAFGGMNPLGDMSSPFERVLKERLLNLEGNVGAMLADLITALYGSGVLTAQMVLPLVEEAVPTPTALHAELPRSDLPAVPQEVDASLAEGSEGAQSQGGGVLRTLLPVLPVLLPVVAAVLSQLKDMSH